MNEQRQYFDIDGNPVTLHKLCKTEPEWAQSRIELMTKEIESLQAEIAQRDKVIERVFTLPKITQEITDTLTSNVLIEQGLGGWEWTQEAVDFIACLKQALENSTDE